MGLHHQLDDQYTVLTIQIPKGQYRDHLVGQLTSPNLAPNSILMVLVDLDVHQIVDYHYFDHHQPSKESSVRLL